MPDGKQCQDNDHVLEQRQRDSKDHLYRSGPVHRGGFVVGLIKAHKGGIVDDAAVPKGVSRG